MLKLAPLWVWTAVSNSTISGVFVVLMTNTMKNDPASKDWTPDHKTKQCLLAMIGQGVGEILGALVFGQVQDRFSNKITSMVCFLTTTCALIACLFYSIVY